MDHNNNFSFPLDKIAVNVSHCAGGHLDAGGEDVSPAGTTEISNSCSLTLLNTNYNYSENETLTNFTTAKKNSNKNESLQNIIQISIQNIRTLTEFKSELFYNIIKESKSMIFTLTEVSLNSTTQQFINKKFKGLGKIISCSKQNGYVGNGIITIIKYPLASRLLSYRILPGRVLNLIFRMRKHTELSIYSIQAPTTPYGEGGIETDFLVTKIAELIKCDIEKNREIIFGGDINSYPNPVTDYNGNSIGTVPSKIIDMLNSFELIDIMRVHNKNNFYTFYRENMKSRLDQYWVTPKLAGQTISSKCYELDSSISDHVRISIDLIWPKKFKNQPKIHGW